MNERNRKGRKQMEVALVFKNTFLLLLLFKSQKGGNYQQIDLSNEKDYKKTNNFNLYFIKQKKKQTNKRQNRIRHRKKNKHIIRIYNKVYLLDMWDIDREFSFFLNQISFCLIFYKLLSHLIFQFIRFSFLVFLKIEIV